jgi:imidazolonepropionase-like amidohydrolase
LTPARAIQAGTKTNAEAMGWQDRVGSIERGKCADLIAVTGNPWSTLQKSNEFDLS